MIHYHGGPITPVEAGLACWQGRHAMISFAHPYQLPLAAEVSQSFALDNGAFSFWRGGEKPEWADYYAWVDEWCCHPGFDWAIIPDVIEGDEEANDALVKNWPFGPNVGVPVWHLHESLGRLSHLCDDWPRIALGSSGKWANPGTSVWWERMARVMEVVTINGRPTNRLHGLRMLNPEIFRRLPLSSADSTNVARNVGMDGAWRGSYQPSNRAIRAKILVERIEAMNSASEWMCCMPKQQEFMLL